MAKKKSRAKKKTKKVKPEKKEIFYVGVQDPVEVRRNVLEVSRDMVQFLQQHQKLTSVRNEKTEAIKHLRQDVSELKTLINKLRRALPKTKLRIKLHKEHEIFKCDRCDQELATKKNLKKHLATHVKHRKIKKTPVKKTKAAKKVKPAKKAKTVKVIKAKPMKAEKKKIPIETQAKLTPPEPEAKKPASEIEKLESELADIENKLGRLS